MKFLTPEEAAQILRFSTTVVRSYARKGIIPAGNCLSQKHDA